jgi:hypothetical protein
VELSSNTRPKKSINLKSQLDLEGINAEFKSLRLRIKRLEQLVLNSKTDSGSLSDDVNNLKKG